MAKKNLMCRACGERPIRGRQVEHEGKLYHLVDKYSVLCLTCMRGITQAFKRRKHKRWAAEGMDEDEIKDYEQQQDEQLERV
jgi:hypothetical protein